MSDPSHVLLTTDQINHWEREAENLARKIADDQARLDQLRAKLKAAEFFRPKSVSVERPLSLLIETNVPLPEGAEGDNLVGAIEKIANEASAPISKKELKRMLAQLGFPPDRLANYFYTAIHRLKSKERISVTSDGKIWKDPHTLEAHNS